MLDPFAAPRLVAMLGRPRHRRGAGHRDRPREPHGRRRAVLGRGAEHQSSPPRDRLAQVAAAVLGSAQRGGTRGRSQRPPRRGLLKSGDHSWATHDQAVLQGAAVRFVAGQDVNGPLPVAAEVGRRKCRDRRSVPEPARASSPSAIRISRATAFSTTSAIKDLLVNTVNWLIREERLMSPRAPHKTPGVNWLFISEGQLRTMFVGAVVVQPILFLVIGVGVALRRRLSP